jgi:hypothetical protein
MCTRANQQKVYSISVTLLCTSMSDHGSFEFNSSHLSCTDFVGELIPRSWTGESWPRLARTRIQLLERSYSGFTQAALRHRGCLLSGIHRHDQARAIFWETFVEIELKWWAGLIEPARQVSHQHPTSKRVGV